MQEGRKFFYPDLVITCDPNDDSDEFIVSNPTVIIEVLSPSTKGFDQTQKFLYYRTISTLQEYLLIGAEHPFIQCYQRQTQDIWTVRFSEGIEAIAHIKFLEIDLPMSEIYEGVSFVKNSDSLTGK